MSLSLQDILTLPLGELSAKAPPVDPHVKARLDRQSKRLTQNRDRATNKRAARAQELEQLSALPQGYIIAYRCQGGCPDTNAERGPVAKPRHPEIEVEEARFEGRFVKKDILGLKRFRGNDLDLSTVRPYRFLSSDRNFNCGGLDMSASRLGTEYAAPFIRARRFLTDPETIDPNLPGDQYDRSILPRRSRDTREMDWGNAYEDNRDGEHRAPVLLVRQTEKTPFPVTDLPTDENGNPRAKVI